MSRTAASALVASLLLLTAMGLLAVGLSAMTFAYAASARGRTPSVSAYAGPLGLAPTLLLGAVGILRRLLGGPRWAR